MGKDSVKRPDYPTVSILSGFSPFCLKIPNPDPYAIGIGKILILTYSYIFKGILMILIQEINT